MAEPNGDAPHALASDVAFTPAVKRIQEAKGSRRAYQSQIARQDWASEVTPDLERFLAERDSAYLGSVTSDGRPYIQHRGGPKGFIKAIGPRRLAFADFAGNRQYLSLGNFAENPHAFLFLMDYANRARVKLWGRARVVEGDPELEAQLADPGYRGRVERAIVFEIDAWDVNCPQHITPRYDEATVEAATEGLRAQLTAALEENLRLKAALAARG